MARELTPADYKRRIINLFAVLLPPGGLAIAIALMWGTAIDATSLALFLGMSTVSAMGVTVGFHRMATHRSFRAPAPVRYLLAAAGSMAVQGPVITWCAEHRRHHLHSDTEGDPHSPHMDENGSWGTGFVAMMRGAFHAHMGWLFSPHSRGLGRYSKDLKRDPVLVAVDRQFPMWVVIGMVLPAVIGGLVSMSWYGALLGFLWGGLIRLFAVHHVTWSVNSICHLWGTRPYDSGDESRNNAIVAVLGFGEGWHNNHHAFPSSARHGLHWWQIDASWLMIRLMGAVGLAKDIRTPSAARLRAMRVRAGESTRAVEVVGEARGRDGAHIERGPMASADRPARIAAVRSEQHESQGSDDSAASGAHAR